jgi:hypothetical protein
MRVTNAKVLSEAIRQRIGKVIVVGADSHGKQYVAASGTINNAAELSRCITQLAEAGMMLRRIRAKMLRAEKRAAA